MTRQKHSLENRFFTVSLSHPAFTLHPHDERHVYSSLCWINPEAEVRGRSWASFSNTSVCVSYSLSFHPRQDSPRRADTTQRWRERTKRAFRRRICDHRNKGMPRKNAGQQRGASKKRFHFNLSLLGRGCTLAIFSVSVLLWLPLVLPLNTFVYQMKCLCFCSGKHRPDCCSQRY